MIADHIRTLTFAIADGIIPSNEGRGYVLRRILRRAVRYGRTLGFHEPFFFKLVDVVALTLGEVFPEVRNNQSRVKETIAREEDSFNRTLDKGIDLFEREVGRILGSARDSRAVSGDSPETSSLAAQIKYAKRRLPHFERPWGKYAVAFSTHGRQQLSEEERDIVLECILFPAKQNHFELYVACVMPDHVHLLLEPQVREQDAKGDPVFYSLTEILQNIKSVSAHRINKSRSASGPVWEKESFDRLIRSESDLQEKYLYIAGNPWAVGVAARGSDYRWLWTWDVEIGMKKASGESPDAARESRALPSISGAFAFRLYDEQGFPLDLTQLMARERGLSVDVAGFEKLMDEQRSRARAAQKKSAIELQRAHRIRQQISSATTATAGRDSSTLSLKKIGTAVVRNRDMSPFYAEMGGQVGDTGEIEIRGRALENCWHAED